MMARKDDRRIFTRDVRLNIVSLQESLHLDIAKLWQQLNFHQQSQTGSMGDMFAENTALAHIDSAEYQLLMRTLKRFVNAKTLGSLIQVPQEEEAELKAFLDTLYRLELEGDFQQKAAAKAFIPYIQQAWILAQRYDAVVANPPYMGNSGMNGELKEFAKINFPCSKTDLFSIFMEHSFSLLTKNGNTAMIVMESWMFLSSYEKMREKLINDNNIIDLIHMPYEGKGRTPLGINFGTSAFIINNKPINYNSHFSYIRHFEIDPSGTPTSFPVINERESYTPVSNFNKIHGKPIAYWLSENMRNIFTNSTLLGSLSPVKQGLATANNDVFLRLWTEISSKKLNSNCESIKDSITSKKKWFPYNKGGDYRKYYGNKEFVVNWENDGYEIKNFTDIAGKVRSRAQNTDYFFKPSITWSFVSSAYFGVRYCENGSIFDVGGSSTFPKTEDHYWLTVFLCSKQVFEFMKIMNPTLNFQVGNVASLPIINSLNTETKEILNGIGKELVEIHKNDWNNYETAQDFIKNELLKVNNNKIKSIYDNLTEINKGIIEYVIELEEKANKLLLHAYDIESEIDYNIRPKDVTLSINPMYRYSISDRNERLNRFQSDTHSELLSYIIGCMMGRYSLNREGLVYAHEGNKGFTELVAEGAYKTFPADNDGILPLMDDEWFDDDVTSRVKEFVRTVWGEEHLQENLDFIAESLCLYAIKPKKGESALDTIRRYLSTQFWKDHLKMYKKRPIYWLFSSGKEKAFECLVYLHRYNDATLARMRTEYVVPLLARYQANIDRLNELVDGVSGGEATRLKREHDSLSKKFNELRSFDDRLRHYADMRISIDLDDGVKVNYGKFGDLLADVKAITGNAPEVI